LVDAGASHVILGLVPRLGPDNLRTVVREVAEALAEVAAA